MSDTVVNESGRPWYASVLMVGAPILLLIGVPFWVVDWTGRRAVRREIEAIASAGAPASYADLEAGRPDIPADRNAALLLHEIADRLERVGASCRSNRALPRFDGRLLPALGEPYPAQLLPAIESLLVEEANVLETIDRLHEHGRGSLPLETLWSHDLTAVWSPFRTAAQLKAMDVLRKMGGGLVDSAAVDTVTMLHIGGSIAQEPSVIGALSVMACDSLAVRSLERVLGTGVCRDATLVAVEQALSDALSTRPLAPAMQGERVALIETVLRGRAMPGSEAGFERLGQSWYGRGWLKHELATALSLLAPLAEPSMSIRESVARARTYDAEVEALPTRHTPARTMMASFQRVFEIRGRHTALLRCALVGLAAERYRLAHGDWPVSPADLAPGYLDRLPADPFVDQPLRYLRSDSGITIYSVGEDERDDGGTVAGRQRRSQRSPDVGFRLLAPHLRGFRVEDEAVAP